MVVWANDEEDPAGIVFKRVPSEDDKPSTCETGEGFTESYSVDGDTLTIGEDTLTRIH